MRETACRGGGAAEPGDWRAATPRNVLRRIPEGRRLGLRPPPAEAAGPEDEPGHQERGG